MPDLLVVDYGMGNLRSVQKALERIGFPALVSGDARHLAAAAKVVLPGVGAFADAMARLREMGLVDPLRKHIEQGKPFLGICLGLQLLFDNSYEDGQHAGLGILSGTVVRFPPLPGLRVPHMGWNELRLRRPAPIVNHLPDHSFFYFAHSYYALPDDPAIIAGETDYPGPFASLVHRDNVMATQFHPEKSQAAGLRLLHNFASLR